MQVMGGTVRRPARLAGGVLIDEETREPTTPQVARQHAEKREGELPSQENNPFGDRNRRTQWRISATC